MEWALGNHLVRRGNEPREKGREWSVLTQLVGEPALPLSWLSGAQETLCPPKIPRSRLTAVNSGLPWVLSSNSPHLTLHFLTPLIRKGVIGKWQMCIYISPIKNTDGWMEMIHLHLSSAILQMAQYHYNSRLSDLPSLASVTAKIWGLDINHLEAILSNKEKSLERQFSQPLTPLTISMW